MLRRMSELVVSVTKTPIAPKQKYLILEVCVDTDEVDDLEVPYIRFKFR